MKDRRRQRAVPLLPEVRFRDLTANSIEVREQSETDEVIIRGSVAVYDTPYEVTDAFGTFTEEIRPGCVTDILDRIDPRLLVNHTGLALARRSSGTLRMIDTPRSLDFEARLDSRQQMANDLRFAIERGDCDQCSIGMIVQTDDWSEHNGREHRVIERLADVLDVSCVTFACSPTTSVAVAQRMALEMPIASRARLKRLYYDARAGRRSLTDAELEAVEIMIATGLEPNRPIGRGKARKKSNPHSYQHSKAERADVIARAEAAIGNGPKDRARALHLRAKAVRQGLG